MLAYLRCHGIAAIGAGGRAAYPHPSAIRCWQRRREDDVGLLVMGAYSHSRLRELLLGGATRTILQNAVARPVLLAH